MTPSHFFVSAFYSDCLVTSPRMQRGVPEWQSTPRKEGECVESLHGLWGVIMRDPVAVHFMTEEPPFCAIFLWMDRIWQCHLYYIHVLLKTGKVNRTKLYAKCNSRLIPERTRVRACTHGRDNRRRFKAVLGHCQSRMIRNPFANQFLRKAITWISHPYPWMLCQWTVALHPRWTHRTPILHRLDIITLQPRAIFVHLAKNFSLLPSKKLPGSQRGSEAVWL
jgi:hypothetical protein